MPSYDIFFYSWGDVGINGGAAGFLDLASGTVSGSPSVMSVTDDDGQFHENPDPLRFNFNQGDVGAAQVLSSSLTVDGGPTFLAGTNVWSQASATVTNASTGQTGYVYVVAIGDPFNGQFGFVSTIRLDVGAVISFGPYDYFGDNVSYNSLFNPSWSTTGGRLPTMATFTGTRSADILIGTSGNDLVSALDGNDEVYGGGGNDTLDGGAGDDNLYGGAGNDELYGGVGNDTFVGGAGYDVILAGDGNDVIYAPDKDRALGGAGNDTFYATSTDLSPFAEHNAVLHGEGGNDMFIIGPGDAAYGGDGDDMFRVVNEHWEDSIGVIGGWLGNDVLDLRGLNIIYDDQGRNGPGNGWVVFTNTIGRSVTLTWIDIETVLRGNGIVDGTAASDLMGPRHKDAQGDLIDGAGGVNDTIHGYAGNDTIDAGQGNDLVDGGTGDDRLFGGAGADILVGGFGADSLDGGAGDDVFTLGAGDFAQGGTGDDLFRFDRMLAGGAGITVVGGEGGEEAIIDPTNNPGGRIGDVLDLRGLGAVLVTYNTADPTFDGNTAESGTATVTNSVGQSVTITFSQIEAVLRDGDGIVSGTAAGDAMISGFRDAQGDQIDGTDGLNDVIVAGEGDDTVDAGLGDDRIDGGVGDDLFLLSGQFGNDVIVGGSGGEAAGDTLDASKVGAVNVALIAEGEGTLQAQGGTVLFSGIETLFLSAGNDTLQGSAGTDFVYGNGGEDLLIGARGADLMFGGEGNDTIVSTLTGFGSPDEGIDTVLSGDDAPFDDADEVYGGGGDDLIFGGDDSDILSGGEGRDFIDGGIDADLIFGDAGSDTLQGGNGRDQIDGGEGNDLIFAGTDGESDQYAADNATDVAPIDDCDIVYGGSGNDTIYGGDDDDYISGGDGDDVLFGGLDRDTLDGGAGNDAVQGGDGADVFVFTAGSHLTVLDFGTGSASFDDGDISNNDFIDLSSFFSSLAEAVADLEDDRIFNQSVGDFSDNLSMEGGSITLVGVTAEMLTFDSVYLM